jgi:hypothetical protein
MAIPQEVQQHLVLTAEQMIRHSGGSGTITPQAIAQRLYNDARPETRGTMREYGVIARAALSMAQAAFTATQDPNTRLRRLPITGSISQGDPKYAFRVIVVARDATGTELFSTAVWVRSDNELTATQVQLYAVQQVSPTPQHYTESVQGRVIASYDYYIMLAGMRS